MSRFVRWTATAAAALLVAGCGSGTSGNGDDKGSGDRHFPVGHVLVPCLARTARLTDLAEARLGPLRGHL